jgi:hypothetical protein
MVVLVAEVLVVALLEVSAAASAVVVSLVEVLVEVGKRHYKVIIKKTR